MKSFGITDKGKVRSENQDSYIIENCDKRKCVIAVICDGMGGAKAGDLASRLSSKEFVSRVYESLAAPRLLMGNIEKLLRDSCADANGVVYEYSRFDANYSGMGTTLVGGIITRRKACLVNVGDSRAYHFTREDVSLVTRDHSMVAYMVERGELTQEQAKLHPGKNVITRAVGTEPEVEGDVFICKLRKEECILLCSDGLSNEMADQEMLFEVVHGMSKSDCCQRLLHIAKNRGAPDNVTVTLAAV